MIIMEAPAAEEAAGVSAHSGKAADAVSMIKETD